MEARLHPHRAVGLSRTGLGKIPLAFVLAALIGGILFLTLTGKPTPTVAGLGQIPASALTELKLRLGADGRPDPTSSPSPVGTLTRSLTGAALLSSGPGTLRFEVSTQYYFRLRDKPEAGPDSWLGRSDEYSVRLNRTSPRPWRVTGIKLIPPPRVPGQG
jgi:hypothetical protein